MARFRAAAAATLALIAAADPAPTGLLCDFMRDPALGVRAAPSFTWIVPPCASAPDQEQVAYRIVVSTTLGAPATVWDSGKVTSNVSSYIIYSGPTLSPSTRYSWTVSTWTQGCTSPASAPATFVTAPWGGWAAAARFISTSTPGIFGYFRTTVSVPANLASAIAFVAARDDDRLLSGYKLYVDDGLASLGPGRGEAPVWGGDGGFRGLPITTLDLTAALAAPGPHVLALQAMHTGGPSVIFQLELTDASGATTTVVTDSSWQAFNGDVHRRPGPAIDGGSAGTAFLEYIDARAEPVGWRAAGFVPGAGWGPAVGTAPSASDLANLHPRMQPSLVVTNVTAVSVMPVPPPPNPSAPVQCGIAPENSNLYLGCADGSVIEGVSFASFGTPSGTCPGHLVKGSCDANTSVAIVTKACVGQKTCTVAASRGLFGDPCYDVVKQLAVEVQCPGTPPPPPPSSSFIVDFGREFQGGLRLEVADGVAGTKVYIACGESLSGNTVGYTWGWVFNWTLRDGPQVLEQHKYMECRFVSLTFGMGNITSPSFSLSAWRVNYPWVDSESSFTSSNATLNAVYDLCRYTLYSAAIDTYTDSNTRERTPYEADGMIAATGRLTLQRDFLWPRHSHAYVIQNPTWPVEWKQLSAFLGWQDFMATGTPDLSLAFMDEMHDRTFLSYLNDSLGVLETENMGNHIVDWMPDASESDETVALHEFTASNHMSVTNFYAARGLDLLSQVVGAGGRADNASQFAAESAALQAAIVKQMWNGTAFCDGVCAEVHGASLLMSNIFSLAFGLVPQEHVATAWANVTAWGIWEIGDFGAFWYQAAITSGYYGPYFDTPDDGTAIVTALAKCDHYSWCAGLLADNLTMTRESWHDGTYSHGWGSSAVVGVSWGVLGVHELAPAWASFLVKPKLGPLSSASGVVPTILGYINVTATPGSVDVAVPCNSRAMLCAPRAAADPEPFAPESYALLLDGKEVLGAQLQGGHLCLPEPVGCGAAGLARQLRVQARTSPKTAPAVALY